jgi:capsid protein
MAKTSTNSTNPRRGRRRKSTPKVRSEPIGGARSGLAGRVDKKTALGYDASVDKQRRKAPRNSVRSEDAVLDKSKRTRAVATARDVRRNFAIARWMVNKHLDFVATFSFQARTGNQDLNERLERLMTWYGKPANCDAAGRHSLRKITRLNEAHATVDGDVFQLKLNSGRLQAIEGDRICWPTHGAKDGMDKADWTHGVKTSTAGRATAYSVCNRRKNGGMEFGRIVQAKNIIPHGYFDRFDQIRGISPLISAINSLQDVYEGFDYALARAKIAQMFGLVIKRQAADPIGPISNDTTPLDGEDEVANPEEADARYSVDVGAGPFKLELEPGDEADFIGDKTPSAEFVNYLQLVISVALKALDIPESFYDSSKANYFAGRGDLIQYIFSTDAKRASNILFLNSVTEFRVRLWQLDGLLPMDLDASREPWEWIPKGLPWWNPLQEVKADLLAVEGNLTTKTEVLKRQGRDFGEVLRERTAETIAEKTAQAEIDELFPPAPPAVGETEVVTNGEKA